MVFGKGGEVIMTATFDPDQGNFRGIDFLQVDAVPDRDQPVLCSMKDIGMALYKRHPFVCPHVEPENQSHRENRQKPFHSLGKTIIRRVQDQVTWTVNRSKLCRESTAHTPSIHDQVIFGVLFLQAVVYKLHVCQHGQFAPFPRAFPEPAVIDKDHVIIVAVKILGIFPPSFYAPAIAMKIENKTFRFFPEKMKPVNPDTGFNIEKKLPERGIIFIGKVLCKFLRFKDQFILKQVGNQQEG